MFADLPTDRTLIMGILNVTPDSFSDGGQHYGVQAALEHARQMIAQGADIIDVGGESTRPGAVRISPEEEQRRILPVIEQLAAEGAVISVDTMNHETARAAVQAGAHIINDVSGMNLSDSMIATVAELGVPYILMHARGDSQTMNERASYSNTVEEVCAELSQLRQRLLAGGVKPENIIIDPGLGFAKLGEQDWQLLAGIERLKELGHPVLIAGSRKRFIAALLQQQDERYAGQAVEVRRPEERDAATAAVSTYAALAGAWAVRVHSVQESADAVAVAAKIRALTVSSSRNK